MNRNYDLVEITMEGYSFGSKGSQAHKIGEGGAATKLALVTLLGGDDRLAYPTLVSPNAVKKFATGKGSGDKNIILMRVFKKWGVEFSDDNMADSFVLSKIAAAVVCDETDHEYESEVVASLERSTEWEPLT
ncbi:MAG: hypothetical protein LC679_15920 [Intrasporangiaceae bacterium]|nr:hypothetical protein [Intrasporangiaceae bacterium]